MSSRRDRTPTLSTIGVRWSCTVCREMCSPGCCPGVTIYRLRNGFIQEWWTRLDELGLLRQLGLA
jgi:hypothetical protein